MKGWLQTCLVVCLVVVAVATAAYLASYLTLLRPERFGIGGHGRFCEWRTPAYRWGGETSERLFAPVQWADQKLRPKYWCKVSEFDISDLDIPVRPEIDTGQ
jgi:hypothetical protein